MALVDFREWEYKKIYFVEFSIFSKFFLNYWGGSRKKTTVISKGQKVIASWRKIKTFIPEAGGYQTIIELVKFKFYK